MLNLFRVSTVLPRKLEDLGVPPALGAAARGLPRDCSTRRRSCEHEELFASIGYRGSQRRPGIGSARVGRPRGAIRPITLAALWRAR